MKLIFKVFIVFIFINNSFASDVVRNGEGPAERNITFVYERLEKYIDTCLSSAYCLKDSDRDQKKLRSILILIRKALPEEKRVNLEQIKFKSEKLEPGFFIIDGHEKIALTGDNIGDNIFINLDLIYFQENNSLNRHISLFDAIQLLIHELGHHQGVSDHILLDTLGARVSKYLEANINETFHTPFILNYSVISLHANSFEQSGELVLNTGLEFVPLNHLFANLKCAKSLMSQANPLISVNPQFFNIKWDFDKGAVSEGVKSINGTIALMCGYKFQGNYTQYYDFEIRIDVTTLKTLRSIKLRKSAVLKRINPLYKIVNGNFILD